MYRLVPAAALGLLALASSSQAATVGGLDGSRSFAQYWLGGGRYDAIVEALVGAGHLVAPATALATADYLATVSVFFTGLPAVGASGRGKALTEEIASLQDWVASGGVLILGGDNLRFTDVANSWIKPFGLTLEAAARSGGTWASGDDPLLAGGVAGAELGFVSGGVFAPGRYDILARVGGDPAVVSVTWGAGLVIGLGDDNFFADTPGDAALRFFVNVAEVADTRALAQTPLPASLPLLAGAGAILVAARRLSRRT